MKRLMKVVLIALLMMTSLNCFTSKDLYAYPKADHIYQYYYDQLQPQAKEFYQAMEEMYTKGIFKTGNTDYDLISSGHVTEEQLKAYASGDYTLLDQMGAARDAFQYDYPDVFYVDFSELSLRVTRDMEGNYHGYLGTGRTDDYYMPGFTSVNDVEQAEKEYEAKINEILQGLPTTVEDSSHSLAEEQTFYLHDYITKNMIYRFENEVSNENCNARTAYDALIYGEGVCEAYTRGFKALMDRAGIPTVCVYGIYRVSDTANEPHIWNYVQIDGGWYGVDVTHDDPSNKAWTEKNSTHETREFCLVGELDLNAHHYSSGIMSSANYEFTYPTLELESLRERTFYANGDLKAELIEDFYGEEGDEELLKSGTIRVSYRGMNYTQNAKEGYYILSRYSQYYPEDDSWLHSDWGYITPELYDVSGGMEPTTPDKDLGYYVNLPLPHIMKAQFAVTTMPPSFHYDEETGITGSLYYEGDPSLLTVVSEEINNKWGTYVKPPYPASVTPSQSAKLEVNQTYHVVIEYDESLKDDGTNKVTTKIVQSTYATDSNTNPDNSKIENVEWHDNVVEFDFTPSKMYADNNSCYDIYINGLIGTKSGKKPVPVNFLTGYRSWYCGLRADGFNWHVVGQPQLLDTADIDTTLWQAVDNETGETIDVKITDKITNRLTLVTSEPSPSRQNEMLDVLENSEYGNENFLKTQTYNIQLTLCKCMIIKTGEGVRVCVGFPKGYDYDSSMNGVTFKAYHYKVDPVTDQLTGEVEEIRCIVTPFGLIIECDAFSPFTIAAVESNEMDTTKNIIINSFENGAIYENGVVLEGANGNLSLEKGDSKTLQIKASEGYEIDTVMINNVPQVIDNVDEMTLDLDYDQLDYSTMVQATFVTKQTHEKEESRGETSNIVDVTGDVIIYLLNKDGNIAKNVSLTLVKVENENESVIATLSGDGKIVFTDVENGTYRIYQNETSFIEFELINGVIYYNGMMLDSLTITVDLDNSQIIVETEEDKQLTEETYQELLQQEDDSNGEEENNQPEKGDTDESSKDDSSNNNQPSDKETDNKENTDVKDGAIDTSDPAKLMEYSIMASISVLGMIILLSLMKRSLRQY